MCNLPHISQGDYSAWKKMLQSSIFLDILGWLNTWIVPYTITPPGAGVVEMKFFTTVNVSDVKVRGTATRGEKIDIESYTFEGNM